MENNNKRKRIISHISIKKNILPKITIYGNFIEINKALNKIKIPKKKKLSNLSNSKISGQNKKNESLPSFTYKNYISQSNNLKNKKKIQKIKLNQGGRDKVLSSFSKQNDTEIKSAKRLCDISMNDILTEPINELKHIKLNRININRIKNNKMIFEPISKANVSFYRINQNPIRLGNFVREHQKFVMGSKFSSFDLSPNSIQKNIYYSKLNNFFRKLNQNKSINKKKNCSNLNVMNSKMNNYDKRRFQEYKKLIGETIDKMNEIKKKYDHWVDDLKNKCCKLSEAELNEI